MSKKQVIELEWFSVDEKLPDVGKSCLIRLSNSKVLLDYYYADEWLSMLDHDGLGSRHKVIEWCYIPLFSYTQDISVDLDPNCEVADDGSVVKLTSV